MDFQCPVAVFSHAMMLVASLLVALVGSVDTAALSSARLGAAAVEPAEHCAKREVPSDHLGHSGVSAGRRVHLESLAPVRGARRCRVKPASENARLVLLVALSSQANASDDEDLAGTRAQGSGPFVRATLLERPYLPLHGGRAPVAQLERPPRA